ncbi:MAG: tRNA 2-thiouridine(34) synthase MnmA [Marinisporobacter sp.]|nr:tRNA 2-thiouridine(34) synthase MnmA [Marinisporobacter sp.]
MIDKNKVAVGLSGGVDSTAAAYLLKREGYEVIGITMTVFDEYDENENVVEPSFIKDAKRIAKILNIPHYMVDYKDIFEKRVKKEFVVEYLKGRTPNPCVTCNRIIKYGKLIETAHSFGAYYIATGHYADICYDQDLKRYRLFRGIPERKDQAYNLHSLSQEQLKHILLPLGKFTSKEEVRKIALKIDPLIGKKSDSTGICFVPNEDHISYLKNASEDALKSGNFVDQTGKIIGKHKGIVRYTIGQKRGLGINFNPPRFVVSIDAKKNEILLGDDKDTYSIGLMAKNVNFTLFHELKEEMKVKVKVCQWGWFLPATISRLGDNRVQVLFDQKERAVAPGQAVVFYLEDEVIGGGIIDLVMK